KTPFFHSNLPGAWICLYQAKSRWKGVTMARGKFFKGTVLLALAGFFTTLIGAVYRIPLARLLGPEGMGLYQMAYPVYTVLWALSAAGVPVAVSLLVAGQRSGITGRSNGRVLTGA